MRRCNPAGIPKTLNWVTIRVDQRRITYSGAHTKMTRTDHETIQVIRTAKRDEVSGAAGRREGIAIERTADALDETQSAAARELTTRVSNSRRSSCATCGEPFPALRREAPARVSNAKKRSARSGYRLCPGPRCAAPARKTRTGPHSQH